MHILRYHREYIPASQGQTPQYSQYGQTRIIEQQNYEIIWGFHSSGALTTMRIEKDLDPYTIRGINWVFDLQLIAVNGTALVFPVFNFKTYSNQLWPFADPIQLRFTEGKYIFCARLHKTEAFTMRKSKCRKQYAEKRKFE